MRTLQRRAQENFGSFSIRNRILNFCYYAYTWEDGHVGKAEGDIGHKIWINYFFVF